MAENRDFQPTIFVRRSCFDLAGSHGNISQFSFKGVFASASAHASRKFQLESAGQLREFTETVSEEHAQTFSDWVGEGSRRPQLHKIGAADIPKSIQLDYQRPQHRSNFIPGSAKIHEIGAPDIPKLIQDACSKQSCFQGGLQ